MVCYSGVQKFDFWGHVTLLAAAQPEFFVGVEVEGAEPEVICNFCFILKKML
jgi:hypothetical protein